MWWVPYIFDDNRRSFPASSKCFITAAQDSAKGFRLIKRKKLCDACPPLVCARDSDLATRDPDLGRDPRDSVRIRPDPTPTPRFPPRS